ncbi:Na+/H+ antiporter [Motilibacter deserti]|uniref:Na+/H+ antiporter n=1 Tax=Motilibacter deserti TaxID=2714956 RepID=A0ABX0GTX7_9ACTN|nr:Na+/H+ antiporter [Motilibacter deserti]
MSTFELCAVLVAGIVVLTPLSRRLGVPQPVVITVFGVLLALVPGVPELHVPPEHILPVVLPPLLFAATLRTSPREFRESALPVALLAVGLTIVTAAVVAVAVHAVGLPWPAAFVLGAIVSPPDPVAATSVARGLGLPARLVTILEGEGLFNDATALVLFQVALSAALAGALSPEDAAVELVVGILGGAAIGLAGGYGARLALARLHDATTETTVSLVLPYAAYLLAEQVGGSGVLAVLGAGLYLRTGAAHRALTSRGWLDGRAVWRFADFALTSLAFSFVGLELTDVLGRADLTRESWMVLISALAAVVLTRAAWVFPASAVLRRRSREDGVGVYGGRETAVVAWSGMRGVVTVATALALPTTTDDGGPFPRHDDIVLTALGVVLVTLLLQGLTLAPLVRALHVGGAGDGHVALLTLRRRAAEAAQERLHGLREAGVDPEAVDVVAARYEAMLRAARSLHDAGQDERRQEEIAHVLEQAIDAEREALLEARRNGSAGAEVVDEVLAEVEARSLRQAESL